jgi:Chemotaxis phosphatase, CheZ
MKATAIPTLNEAEYLAIDDAIGATSRGRAFLRYRDGIGRTIGADAVCQLLRGFQDWVAAELAPDHKPIDLMRGELLALREHIDQAKAEMSGLVVDEATPGLTPIRGATAELDETVNDTAKATNDILTAAEAIHAAAQKLTSEGSHSGAFISERCMDIFLTCSFQDITGQRIAKVIATLAHIERRVNAMLAIGDGRDGAVGEFAAPIPASAPKPGLPVGPTSADDTAALLNGPPLPGFGLDQNSIDALMNGESVAIASPAPGNGRPPPAGQASESIGQANIDLMFDNVVPAESPAPYPA